MCEITIDNCNCIVHVTKTSLNFKGYTQNQRTNGPLISGYITYKSRLKIAEQTLALTLITQDLSFIHLINYIQSSETQENIDEI